MTGVARPAWERLRAFNLGLYSKQGVGHSSDDRLPLVCRTSHRDGRDVAWLASWHHNRAVVADTLCSGSGHPLEVVRDTNGNARRYLDEASMLSELGATHRIRHDLRKHPLTCVISIPDKVIDRPACLLCHDHVAQCAESSVLPSFPECEIHLVRHVITFLHLRRAKGTAYSTGPQ